MIKQLYIFTLLALTSLTCVADNERSVDTERAIKIGTVSAVSLNIDSINSALSGMGNNAVRKPIGDLSLEYEKVGWTQSYGTIYSDTITLSLVLPVAEDFGVSLFSRRYQLTAPYFADFMRANLFWRNPKDGSFSIYIDRDSTTETTNAKEYYTTLGIGYSLKDSNLGYLNLGYDDVIGGRYSAISLQCFPSINLRADGYSSSAAGGLYLDSFELRGSLLRTKRHPEGCENIADVHDSKSLLLKYELEEQTLSTERTWSDNSAYSNRLTTTITHYPNDNLSLSLTHTNPLKNDWLNNYKPYTKYDLKYQVASNDYQFGAYIEDYQHINLFGVTLTTNLGRKRSIKAADRDRDPF